MTNRATRRKLSQSPAVRNLLGTDSQGPQAMTGALFAALTSDCTCKACRLLRKAAKGIGDAMLEDEGGENPDPDSG